MIVDDGIAIVLRVSPQLLAKPVQVIRRFLDTHSIALNDFAAMTDQQNDLLIRVVWAAVP